MPEVMALIEGQAMSKEGWLKALNYDRDFFEELLNSGALQRRSTSGDKKIYRLNFVGIMSTKNLAWFSFPKIYDCVDDLNAIGSILRCLRRYEHFFVRSSNLFEFGGFEYLKDGGSIIDGFLELIDWTDRRGFHRAEIETFDNLQSNINWQRTLNETLAIHSRQSVLYPHPISVKRSTVISELGILQATALLQYREALGPTVDLIAPALDDLWAECADIMQHSSEVQTDPTSCSQILDEYGYRSQRDEDLSLIQYLRFWVQSEWTQSRRPLVYGLTSFHTVWEHMCIQACNSTETNSQHAIIASQPYCVLDGSIISMAPQRPDILIDYNQGVIIADAKWYRMDNGEIPGTPDAIKQIAYQETIDPTINVVGNVLLLPSRTGQPWRRSGEISMQYANKPDARFAPITLVGLDWELVVNSYLEGAPLPSEFFDWLASNG